MDGTFRTAPSPYRQYFSIYGKYRDRVICLVNVLMTGQLIGQYKQANITSSKAKCQKNKQTSMASTPSSITL